MEFQYKAKTLTGKTQSGTYIADTEQQVIDFIRNNGWIPVDIKTVNHLYQKIKSFWQLFVPGISLRDKSIFYKHLSIMIASGIPIEKSLLILQEQENKHGLKNTIQYILMDVRNGSTVAKSLGTQRYFGNLDISMIRAGEEAGLLDIALLRLSEIFEKQDLLRKKIIAASTYPLLVLLVAVIVLLLVTVYILPQFESTFYQMNIPIPAFSSAVFTVGRGLRDYGIYIPMLLLAIIALAVYLQRSNMAIARKLDEIKLKLPVFGNVCLKAALARSFRIFGLMLGSGIAILPALRFSGEVSGNIVIKEDFDKMFDAAEKGKSLYNILNGNRMYPVLVVQIIKIGEETGKTDDKFIELANMFENDLDDTIRLLSSVLEPILVIIVGILVAIMLFAVYLPILDAVRNFI